MKLSSVVPWGRSLEEYRAMFSLSGNDLKKTIVGCGDGPACFNAEVSKMGGNVVSVDPIYQFDADEIGVRIKEVYPEIMDQLSENKDKYVWKSISDIEELAVVRMKAMEMFLADYTTGKSEGRYVNAMLPKLPFEDKAFNMALCSHYLFLYSEQVSLEAHILSLLELCRVAEEVRVYPLLSLDGKLSKYLAQVMSTIEKQGINVFLEDVAYQIQKGATQMLVAMTE